MSAERQKTILLVDDEAIIAMAEKMSLEKYGYDILIAHSGEEAIAAAGQTPGIDLILMDINLGKGMDGTEAAARILKEHDLPVVFLSSHIEPEVVEKTEKITSYGYVVKNSSSTVLDASIKMAFKLFDAKKKEMEKEVELAQSRDLLINLARLVPSVIYQYRLYPDGRSAFPYSSPGMNDIYEVTPEEVREDATPVFGRLHPDDYGRVADAIQESARTLHAFFCEFRVILPRQGLRWRWSQAHPERMADGGTLWHGIISDITERKQAEEELKKSQLLLKSSIESPKDMIILSIDKQYCYLYFNTFHKNVMAKAYGKNVELGMNLLECITNGEDRIKSKINYDRALAGESHASIEEYGDLNRHYYETRYNPIVNDEGEVIGATAFSTDVSERKRVEAALLESEARYRKLFENISSGVAVYEAVDNGEDFVFRDFNPAAEKTEKISRKDILGKRVSEVFPGVREFGVFAVFQRVWRTGRTEYFPENIYKDEKDPGSWRENWVFKLPSGEIVAIYNDITERKRAESQREAALEALRESEDRYRDLVENSQDLICTHDLEGKVLTMNEAAARLTGYPLKDLLNMNMADLLLPEFRHLFKPYLAEIKAKGWARGTMRVQTASGEHRYWEFYNTLRDKGVTTPVVRGLGRDITERERIETLERAVYDIARAADEAESLDKLFPAVHLIIQGLMPAANFLIALYDEKEDLVSFPYFVDEKDPAPPPRKPGKGLTDYVLATGRALLCDAALEKELSRRGEALRIGSLSSCWLGVPLKAGGKTIGVIALDNYSDPHAYGEREKKVLEYVSGQVANVIERKRAEKALRESEERFRSLYENSTIGIYRTTPEGKIVMANPTLVKMLGYASFAEVASRNLEEDWFQPSYPRRKFIEKFNEQDEVIGLESAWKRRDGSVIFIREGARAVRDAQGTILHFDGTVEDITERKQAEEEIQRQLAEKEILLKEVHHRIKNNIAAIGALIALRLQSISNPEACVVLKDAIGRVNSMRILYDKLLLSEGYKDISVKNYVESIVETIVSLFPESPRLTIDQRIADFQLDQKRLSTLGIIINELLTNIMKYAFRDLGAGSIKIALAKAGNRVTLTIRDNGIGLPDGFDINRSTGFGFTVVKMLSQQLGGSFSIKRHKGTLCRVEFAI